MNVKTVRPQVLADRRGAEFEAGDTSSMPALTPTVNISNPRLWRALRKFDRNLKRIIRLREKNQVLLEEMRRLQGMRA